MIFLQLYFEFFKIGLFAVGGGLASLPFIYELSAKTGWFTDLDIANMVAVSESTPGPLGVNMATYVGCTTTGLGGGVVATLGLITPSILIIILIAAFLNHFEDNRYVKSFFGMIRPVAVALITVAWLGIVNLAFFGNAFSVAGLTDIPALWNQITAVVDWRMLVYAAVLLVFIKKVQKYPIPTILVSAAVGIVLKL